MLLLRALVVERNQVRQALWTQTLETLGFESSIALDGINALRLASEDGVDLLVLDLDSSRIGGADLVYLIGCGVFGAAPPPTIIYAAKERLAGLARTNAKKAFATLIERPSAPDHVLAAVDEAFAVADQLARQRSA